MKRLRKSTDNKMIFGVAGGVADYFGTHPLLIRVAFVLLAFANGIGLLLYLALALLMPKPQAVADAPGAVLRQNLRAVPRELSDAGRKAAGTVRSWRRSGEGAGS
jgi:phage shock protein PspC (stress-responsive transcriptional regulator)